MGRPFGLISLAGIAVAYAFVDILPHLAGKQEKLAQPSDTGIRAFLQHEIYMVTLVGFLFYLGVILWQERSKASQSEGESGLSKASIPVKIRGATGTGHNLIIGYMLAQQPIHRVEPSLVFAVAMSAHLIGLDHLSHQRYPKLYESLDRYLRSAGLIAGWTLGYFVEFPGVFYAVVIAFLAGGIIVVTSIFELPRIKSLPRYWSFCGGAAAFTLIILVLEFLGELD